MNANNQTPLVGILMGSKSDWETMQAAAKILTEFGIPHEAKVASAHRSPDLVSEYVTSAEGRGLQVIIAAAGLAAHLPGVVAAQTLLPVLGVPMHSQALGGLDALLDCWPSRRCPAVYPSAHSPSAPTARRTQPFWRYASLRLPVPISAKSCANTMSTWQNRSRTIPCPENNRLDATGTTTLVR
jgi:hypothetical protein